LALIKGETMVDERASEVSRRNWLKAASTPMIAAAAVAALNAETPAAGADGASASNLAGARTFNVRDFGAKGDGKSLDTAAIQSAIDACATDHGGIVLVPAGSFLTGSIELKSNVTLRIAADGKLLATTDASQYHADRGIPIEGDHTMGDGNVALVYAAEAENITIEGPGTIDGQGVEVRAAGLSGPRRPHLLLFYHCKNLTIRDIYLYHSAYHTCRIANSSYVNLDGVRINSRVVGNNDGFHFISAEYVNMTNCNVRSQDDACALFGSCKFIMISNCSFSTRWSVFRFGGGIAENVVVSNCLLYQVFGCPIKLRCEKGSRYENMSFSNLILQEVTGPISIGAGPMREPAEPGSEWPGGIVRNISFNNISGTVNTTQTKLDDSTFSSSDNPGELHSAIILNGVDGLYLENISLSNIHLTFGGGGTAEEAGRRKLPQIAGEYFALGAIPAYGLYARNVHGLDLSNIRFQVATPELRPTMFLDKVHDAAINGLSAQAHPEAESLVRLINCRDILVTAPRVLGSAAIFACVEGADTQNISIAGGDLTKAKEPLAFADGANKDAVKLRV
jgi:Glycosyl hydrolases family 28